MTGEAGADARGLWLDDPDTGTAMRLGEVGRELAASLAPHNAAASRSALSRPHIGLWFSKTF